MSSEPQPSTNISLMQVFTAVLWISCLLIGYAGMVMKYPRPMPPTSQPALEEAQMLDVAFDDTPLPANTQAMINPAPLLMEPMQFTPSHVVDAAASRLALISIAQPQAVNTAVDLQKSPPAPYATVAPLPVFTKIFLGVAAGRQPKPEYPLEAQLAHQQGTVVAQFTVDPDGHISDVTIRSPCPWPLLNQSASRAIRDTWAYSPGPRRYYEISITFQGRSQ